MPRRAVEVLRNAAGGTSQAVEGEWIEELTRRRRHHVLHPGSPGARQHVRERRAPSDLSRESPPGRGLPGDRALPPGDGGPLGRAAPRASPGGRGGDPGPDLVGPVGTPHRPDRADAPLEGDAPDLGREGARRHSVRTAARPLLAPPSVRARPPLRALVGGHLLPARDDRRRGEDARHVRKRRPRRPGVAAPDRARPRPRLDLGPVDDRADRGIRRGGERDRGAARRGHAGGSTGTSGSRRRRPRRWP